MSSVLVLIIIPDYQCETEVREKEKANPKLKKKLQKELSINLEEIEENGQENSLEKIVQDGLSYLGIPDATWQKSMNGKYWHISFPVDLEDSDIVLQYFKSHGIGLRFSTSIGIIPFSLFCYNEESSAIENGETQNLEESKEIISFKEKQGKFLKSVTARLTVAQIVSSVRSDATLTFDFICYLVFASWIAAMGLLDESVISLVASMLVSPMMGPVMALTFGTIIKDRSLRNMGFKNIFVCLMVTIGFGFLFGMIALNFTSQWDINKKWPSDMMRERGLIRVIWVGTLVAFPSGCAVAISMLSGNNASLVGVAISVSLLPPAVNAGLLWAFSLLRFFYSLFEPGNEIVKINSTFTKQEIHMPRAFLPMENYQCVYDDNMSIESLILGILSLCLSLVNIANIIIGALLLLKIKEIVPLTSLSPESRRFFQEDIRIAREYNEKSGNGENGNLGESVLKEWADINGLEPNALIKPEARLAGLQTLVDIAKDVQADQVFQTVTKNMNIPDNLAPRLSQDIFENQQQNLKDLRYSKRSRSIMYPSIIVTEDSRSGRRPSMANFNAGRRRISTVALNRYHDENFDESKEPKEPKSCGFINNAFNFNETDIDPPTSGQFDTGRRRSSAILRRSLQNSNHSPLSCWPATRFTVVNHGENFYSQSPPKNTD